MTVEHYLQQIEKTTFALGVDNLNTFSKNAHTISKTNNRHLKTYMVPPSLLLNKALLSHMTTIPLYLINKQLKKTLNPSTGSEKGFPNAVTATNLDTIG